MDRVALALSRQGRTKASAPTRALLNQSATAAVWFGIRCDDHGRRDTVSGLHVQEANPLRISTRLADCGRVHANDFAVVADQHDFGSFIHLRDSNDLADTLGGFQIDYTFATAVGEAIFLGGGALPEAVFGNRKDEGPFDGYVDNFGLAFDFFLRRRRSIWLGGCGHANNVVVLVEVDTPDTISGASHRAHMAFVEADGHAFMRGEEDDLVAVGDAASYEFVAVFDSDGVDSVRAHVHEFTQLRFLHETIAGSKEDVLVLFFKIADCQHRLDGLARLQGDKIADVLAFAGGADVRNFVNLKPVHAALVGEDHDVGVRGGQEEMLNEILVARLHAGATSAPAALHAVGRDGRPLHVTRVAYGDGNLLVGDEIFENDFCRFVFNARAALISI